MRPDVVCALASLEYVWTGSAWQTGPTELFARCTAGYTFYHKRHEPHLSHDFGSGMAIYGVVERIVPAIESGVARWNGSGWDIIGAEWPPGGDDVWHMVVHHDIDGDKLVVTAQFQGIGGVAANNIAMWDGERWSPLGHGVSGHRSLASYDDGTGPAIYVGGEYELYIPNPALWNMAKWDGKEWTPVGGGLNCASPNCIQQVNALGVFDDGRGPALFAAGAFNRAGGLPVKNIARWDGQTWEPLGAGIGFQVDSFATYDDGRGSSLFIAGSFSSAGAGISPGVAQWVGTIGQCYPDCDNNQTLNVSDLICYTSKLALRDPYADCDVDGDFDATDLVCFQTRFAQGCP